MREGTKIIMTGLVVLAGTTGLYFLIRKGRKSKFERGKA
jgi:hypothetical protein